MTSSSPVSEALGVVKDALLTVTDKVYRGSATGKVGNYIVYQLSSDGDSKWADNKRRHRIVGGTVDLFTRDDELFYQLEEAMQSVPRMRLRLEDVLDEDDTHYTHYTWRWSYIGAYDRKAAHQDDQDP